MSFRPFLHLTILTIAVVLPLSSLQASQPSTKTTPEQIEFFEKRIRPLLVSHCYECHSQGAKKVKGNLYLDSRAGVRKGGRSGVVLVAGQPQQSLLIQAVQYRAKDLAMQIGRAS